MGKHTPRLPVRRLPFVVPDVSTRKNVRVPANRTKGEERHGVKVTDHEVELIRDLHENDGWGYRRLAKAFDLSCTHIKRLVLYKLR